MVTTVTVAAAVAIAHALAPDWSPLVHTDEIEADYHARVTLIGESAWAVAGEYYAEQPWVRLHWARGLLVIVAGESHYRRAVHAGDVLGDRGRARCLAQIHSIAAGGPEAWAATSGVDRPATERCLGAALRVLRGAVGACARMLGRGAAPEAVLAGAVARYGSGRPGACLAPTAQARQRARSWLGSGV